MRLHITDIMDTLNAADRIKKLAIPAERKVAALEELYNTVPSERIAAAYKVCSVLTKELIRGYINDITPKAARPAVKGDPNGPEAPQAAANPEG